MPSETVRAINIVEPSNRKKEEKQKVKPKRVLLRQKRPIQIFSEKLVKRVSLKFLNQRFKVVVKSSVPIKKDNFFVLLSRHIDCVVLSKGKIAFCKLGLQNKPTELVFLNYDYLKNKYKRLSQKVLKTVPLEADGAVRDKKAVMQLMIICQSAYVRSYGDDKKLLVPLSTSPRFKKAKKTTTAKVSSAASLLSH